MQIKRKKYSKFFFDKPKKSAIQLERERKSGLFVIFLKAQTQIQ